MKQNATSHKSKSLQSLLGNETLYICLFIAAGLAGRLMWLFFVNGELTVAGGEAQNVAGSVFRDWSVADAFGRGSGLTAHVNPLLPMLAGILYRLFGWGAPAAEIILMIISFGCTFGAALVFYDCFKKLGVPIGVCLAGLAMFCLLPLNLRHEVVMFRIWEGGIAALTLAIGLRQLIVLDKSDQITSKEGLVFALTAAFGLFVNPSAGLTLYAAGAIFMIRNMSIERASKTVAVATAVLIVVLAPWTARNAIAFGEFVPLRSNYGLEIALANHPGVLSGNSESEAFTQRWKEIHPFATQEAFNRMQQSGNERLYTERLGKEASAWMRQNPGVTLKLAARHLVQFYFPPTWQYQLWGGPNRGSFFTTYATNVITLLAIVSSILFLLVRGGKWVYPLIFLIVPALPYALVQPTARYHYLISTLTMYLAASLFYLIVAMYRSHGRGKTVTTT